MRQASERADGQGRTVDFHNTILVLTSNLGSQCVSDPLLTAGRRRDKVTRIVDLQVSLLPERLCGRRLVLTVTDAARGWLSLTGLRPGARRAAAAPVGAEAIRDAPARALLSGEVRDGDEVVDDRADTATG